MSEQPHAVNPSFWMATSRETAFPELDGEVAVDVAVVGAGITGIVAATLLKRARKTVALLDSKRIVRGVSGYTTAKLTVGHGLIYERLIDSFGETGARVYAQSNQAAIEWIAQLAEDERIDCDFERASNYVYTESAEEVDQIRSEVEAARRTGIDAAFTTDTDLPYDVAGAIRVDGQAQFHPHKFLLPLAEAIPGDGSHVFELTRALDVDDGEPSLVTTTSGSVRARDVILATHIPFPDRGLFFAKAHPSRSYALAARIDDERAPRGMYITSSQPNRSIRSAQSEEGRVLILGGEGHRPGAERDTERRYAALQEFLSSRFGIEAAQHRWSSHDYIPVDGAPYIGRLTRRSKHVYIATGFAKWGLTKGVVAAMILSDRILGRENAWADFYDAKRVTPKASARRFALENAGAGWHFIADRVRRGPDIDQIAPGEGAIVSRGRKKLAVYRNESGEVRTLSAVCQHLYCLVEWNTAEKTWDCPCHGSRYSAEGTMIQGPTVRDLQRVELSD